jgi:hypothetical protein
MHCVRGYGHLLQLFSGLTKQPDVCPPKVMLHSYGGSVEEIPRFCKLRGIGDRFYFSFSHAINARTPEKLAARIAAVPDDRLLIESDQVGKPMRAVAAVVWALFVLTLLHAVLILAAFIKNALTVCCGLPVRSTVLVSNNLATTCCVCSLLACQICCQ